MRVCFVPMALHAAGGDGDNWDEEFAMQNVMRVSEMKWSVAFCDSSWNPNTTLLYVGFV